MQSSKTLYPKLFVRLTECYKSIRINWGYNAQDAVKAAKSCVNYDSLMSI